MMAKSLLFVIALTATASAAPTAPEVLANMQKFYASAPQLTAKFRQVVTNKAFGTTESNDGRIYVAKPIKLRAEYLSLAKGRTVPKKDFIYDGKTLWYLDHVGKTVTKTPAASSVLPAAVSFLTGGDQLAKDFTVTLDPTLDPKFQAGATVLLLVPKAPSAQIKELRFVVNTKDWHISRSIVIDPKGDASDFSFFEPDLKTAILTSTFTVDPKTLTLYKLQTTQAPTSGSGSASGPVTRPTP